MKNRTLLVKIESLELRKNKKALTELSGAVFSHLRQMDVLMKYPSNVERGKKIAQSLNRLEFANDQVRYFHLGVDFRKDRKV